MQERPQQEEELLSIKSGGGESGMVELFVRVLQSILPTLERVKCSIKETSSTIPKASTQLNKVTEATETATVEILNVLEGLSQNVAAAERDLSEWKNLIVRRKNLSQEIRKELSSSGALGKQMAGKSDQLSTLLTLWDEYADSASEEERVGNIEKYLARLREDSLNIAMALQVQDITTQQINSTIHLIESVQLQLKHALAHIEAGGNTIAPPMASAAEVPLRSEEKSFDTHATYSKATDRQRAADDIVRQWNGGQ